MESIPAADAARLVGWGARQVAKKTGDALAVRWRAEGLEGLGAGRSSGWQSGTEGLSGR